MVLLPAIFNIPDVNEIVPAPVRLPAIVRVFEEILRVPAVSVTFLTLEIMFVFRVTVIPAPFSVTWCISASNPGSPGYVAVEVPALVHVMVVQSPVVFAVNVVVCPLKRDELRTIAVNGSRANFFRNDLPDSADDINLFSDDSVRRENLNKGNKMKSENEKLLLRLIRVRFSFFLSDATSNISNKYKSDVY